MSIWGVWAVPGGGGTLQKDGGLRPPPFWKVSRPPEATETPKIVDSRSVKKSYIKNPAVILLGSGWGSHGAPGAGKGSRVRGRPGPSPHHRAARVWALRFYSLRPQRRSLAADNEHMAEPLRNPVAMEVPLWDPSGGPLVGRPSCREHLATSKKTTVPRVRPPPPMRTRGIGTKTAWPTSVNPPLRFHESHLRQ